MSEMAEPGMGAAEREMRLVLMGTGAMTLDEINRSAPGLARAVVNAYLYAWQTTTPAEPEGL